ncbi:hypothetical protein ABTX34_23885 [Streptomyces sp. NPDC096538]|uniref:hypothetical protein n=1 Tax=Streptomyces sp. NPDC096538 TaxID=3155427 RepID=UPI0033317D53
MGVFARLFRRSKTTEETSSAEARTDGTTAGTGTDDAAATAQPEAATEAPETSGSAAKESDEVAVTENVDIPKQQSGKAAESEAGDGART